MKGRMYRSVAHNFLKRLKEKASSANTKMASSVRKPVKRFRRFRSWIKSEGARYSEYLEYLKYYGAYLFVYGFLLNYALYVLLTFEFPTLNVYTVPGYGIAYYFVKEEVTEILSMLINTWKGRIQ